MKKLLLCLFCALLAMTLVFAAAAEDDHIHTYDGGSFEEEIDYDNPSYAPDDEYDHRVTYDVYIYPVCDECGQRGSTSQMGDRTEYEAHEWKDSKCVKCGYVCKHNDDWDEDGKCWLCGYACPQTVFLEGVYRRVERLVEDYERLFAGLLHEEPALHAIASGAGHQAIDGRGHG